MTTSRLSRPIPRHLKYGLIALGVIFAITLGLFVDVVGHIQSMVGDKEPEENPFTPPKEPLYKQTDPPMQVKVFFPSTRQDIILSAEEQTIFRSAELANRARQLVSSCQFPTAVGDRRPYPWPPV